MIAVDRKRRELDSDIDEVRQRCESLAGFVREAWPLVEPDTTLVWNWHLDAICEHLEAVTAGKITRLLINVPPGSSKSMIVSVLWPAWEWGPANKPWLRYLTTSFNDGPVRRDLRKSRDLMLGDWYRRLWPGVKMTRAAETSYANSRTGSREGHAFGSLTSQRGDRLVIDDPHSIKTAESEAQRQTTTRLFREGALNRLNDQQRSAIVIIMQRLHENDVSGTVLSLGLDYCHLMIPMEFEADRAEPTAIGWRDPRKKDGELMDPKRFPREEVEQFKVGMGSFAYAGQYQQRPTAREGNLFKRAWFADKRVKAIPVGTIECRGWDLAGTALATAAATAGVRLGLAPDGRIIVINCRTDREEGKTVRKLIKATAEDDGEEVYISLPQDPGQAGKSQAQDFVAFLAGYRVHTSPESGDKVTRAEPLEAQAEAGNVYLLESPEGDNAWIDPYLNELCSFPGGTFSDRVDATSRAYARLVQLRARGESDSIGLPSQVGAGPSQPGIG